MTARLTARFERRLSRLPATALAGVLVLLISVVLASPAAAATGPRWEITSLGVPTHFVPGDEGSDYTYRVTAINVGDAAREGTVTLTDQLPAGLSVESTVLRTYLPEFGSVFEFFGFFFCSEALEGASVVVTCTVPEESFGFAVDPLAPGEALRLAIHVVAPSFSGPLTNVAKIQGGGAPEVETSSVNEASPTPAAAGFARFKTEIDGADTLPTTTAGSHPRQFTTSFAVNTEPGVNVVGLKRSPVPAEGDVKDISVDLPPGLIGNPTATSQCTAQQFNSLGEGATLENSFNACPNGSVVGMIEPEIEGSISVVAAVPVYNLVPPKGMPAQLGFTILGLPFYIDTKIRTGGDYGVTAYLHNVTEIQRLTAGRVTLWGTPAAQIHDPLRGSCLSNNAFSRGICPADLTPKPLLRLPTSCAAPMTISMSFDTWTSPGSQLSASSSAGTPDGCAPLDFSPSIAVRPDVSAADSPTGLRVDLHMPQSEDPGGLAEADLKDAVVRLPAGLAVNPSGANGLTGCSPAQIDLHGEGAAACPDAAKVGSVEVDTPLIDHSLPGAVYVATPHDNPFGSLLAIYVVVDDPQSGIVVKLAGRVDADSQTGQLTATFSDNPQLPFADFRLHFFEGPEAALRTPTTCGTFATTSRMTPWSEPQGTDATPSDSFSIDTGAGGSACAGSEAEAPHRPSFEAGTMTPIAGSYSPFVLRLAREDGSQTLSKVNVTPPPGLLAKLAGVPYCPQAAIDAAARRRGTEELTNPSCPVASKVGTVTVGAGAGPSPYHVHGDAYLAGPYKGAPLSLVVLTPAVAGPYDLGTVVVRSALHVDPETAQVTLQSDPLPTILEGIPLDIRSIAVKIDRPSFILNPTSCEAMSVGGAAISALGKVAPLSDRFQVGACAALGFRPRLSTRLSGPTHRGGHPALQAVLRMPTGNANIARAAVSLPSSELLDQAHIRTVCTRVQFSEGACPKGAIYGYARAKSPLLDEPLRGPVYLRSSSHELPDLVADLRGQIHIALSGRIDSVGGGIRTTFEAVPDAPVSKFVLTMKGGQKGLLVNSTNVCRGRHFAAAKLDAHNGRIHDIEPLLGNPACRRHRR